MANLLNLLLFLLPAFSPLMATAISTTAPSMLSHPSPSASSFSSHSDESRVVRFDNECVLIPDLQRIKRPILITKSYSLPIWKRRSEEQLAEEAPALKVAFPTLKCVSFCLFP